MWAAKVKAAAGMERSSTPPPPTGVETEKVERKAEEAKPAEQSQGTLSLPSRPAEEKALAPPPDLPPPAQPEAPAAAPLAKEAEVRANGEQAPLGEQPPKEKKPAWGGSKPAAAVAPATVAVNWPTLGDAKAGRRPPSQDDEAEGLAAAPKVRLL